jgi:N-acyl-D-amino-acid deacylase
MGQPDDLIIRNGRIADGTGSEVFVADIAVADGRIAAVGPDLPPGRSEFDAAGLLVTPGFVDVHTHYDGQLTWESRVAPSSDHGVTTIVTGNCGVGFAPCRPEDHDELVDLMAGVEDIPEVVMTEGLDWTWVSFAEYLDRVDAQTHDVDIAAMVPHSALRVFVMGDRAVRREHATQADIVEMARLTREALAAGAIGFGTSRAIQQRSAHGEPIPTVRAAEDELRGILDAMAEAGTGVFQALSDFELYESVDAEFSMFRRLVSETGRPMSFTLNQRPDYPEGWHDLLARTEQASSEGLPIKGQVLGRPAGILLGHDLTRSPFSVCPTFTALGGLPFADKITQLRRPDVRDQIVAESTALERRPWDTVFELTDPPDYEPDPAVSSIAARAASAGVSPAEFAYDLLLEDDGQQLFLHATQNYLEGSLRACHRMLSSPSTIPGLGDGGAHLGLICDASWPTTMLAHWTRDRSRGPKLDLVSVVKAMTSEVADAVGLQDRGRIAVGYKADVNVIDYDRVRLRAPHVVHDLPAGGRRILQQADGYVATFVTGTLTHHDGKPTGQYPGRVVRGAQPPPAG